MSWRTGESGGLSHDHAADAQSSLVCQLDTPQPTREQLERFVSLYGGSARDAYEYARDEDIAAYQALLNTAISKTSDRTILDAVNGEPITLDEGSHKVFLVEPTIIESAVEDTKENRSTPSVSVATRFVMANLWKATTAVSRRELRRLYGIFIRYPKSKGMAGSIFEPCVHQMLQDGGAFTINKMEVKTRGTVNVHYGPASPNSTQTMPLKPHRLSYFHSAADIDTSGGRLLPTTYYQPEAQNYATFDSFIADPQQNILTLFQCTVALVHDAKPVGLKNMQAIRDKHLPGAKLRYVAVIPADQTITIKIPLTFATMESSLEVWFIALTNAQVVQGTLTPTAGGPDKV